MVLSADKERVKSLLKETITLLCRNGLTFKSKFSIEALIGVTLDDEDIFLISINELIKSETNSGLEESQACDDEASEGSFSDSASSVTGQHRTRKRHRGRRSNIKTEPQLPTVSDAADEQEDAGDQDVERRDSTVEDANPVKKLREDDGSMDEAQDNTNEEDDTKDIVFIKEEIDTWSNNTPNTSQSNLDFQGTPTTAGNNTKFNLSDMNLVPISAQDEGSMMWQTNTHQPLTYRRRSSTTTGSSLQQVSSGPVTGQQQPPPQIYSLSCAVCGSSFPTEHQLIFHPCPRLEGSYRYSCQLCGKRFNSTGNLRGHLAVHTGQKEFWCPVCDKEFAYKSTLQKHVKTAHFKDS